MSKCEYCKTPVEAVMPMNDGARMYVGAKDKELIVGTDDNAYGAHINYCPMCGRKLVEDEN